MGVINEPGALIAQSSAPKIQAAVRMAENYQRTLAAARNGTTPPPVRFGKVTTAFTAGDATVELETVRFDDLSTSVASGETFTVYVGYFGSLWQIGSALALNAVVPFHPFNGTDANGHSGILAGDLLLAQVDNTPFLATFTLDGSTPSIQFNDGEVYSGASSPTTVSDGASKFAIATDKWFWVEITVTGADGGSTPSVNATLQSGVAKPDEWTVAAGNLTIKWIIGHLDTGVWYQQWTGDVHLLYPEMPAFHADVQGAAANAVKLPGYDEHTSSDNSLDSYFFKGRETELEFQGGGLRSASDAANAIQFGGRDLTSTLPYTSDIDVGTADQITFTRKQWAYKLKSGLMQTLVDAAAAGLLVQALKWIGIEVGGQIVHNPSPVDGTSHADHWFYVTFTITNGISIDGGGAVNTITLYFDRTGHLWKYDSTTQPAAATNYRYRHCSYPDLYPDLIFSSQQANPSIEVLGECYIELSATTDEDATSPTPTVNATYASCAACAAGATNEQWLKCSDDSTAAVLSPGTTAHDYAWLCLSSVWVKCYNGYLTSTSATDPSVLEQCDGTPVSCATLYGLPASDDYTGSGCNSGTVGDVNYGIKYNPSGSGTFGVNITGNQLALTASGSGAVNNMLINGTAVQDFTFTINYSSLTLPASNTWDFALLADYSGGVVHIGRTYNAGAQLWRVYDGSVTTTGADTATSGSFVLTKSGTSWTATINGTLRKSWTLSATITSLRFQLWSTGGTGNASVNVDSFTLVDGSANPVYIDPSGVACT